jgi:DNA polymerase
MRVKGEGPIPSRIMIVGEAPGEQEERTGVPFAGAAGQELNRMLHEVGILRSECYTTNVCKVRPADNQISNFVALSKKGVTGAHTLLRDKWCTREVHEGYAELLAEIEMVQPNIIIAFGNLALWALTGHWAITKWRGSLLRCDPFYKPSTEADWPKVIPTIHPAAVLREWSQRAVVLNDLRRVKKHMTSRTYDNRPEWNFKVRPTFSETINTLKALTSDATAFADPVWLDFDIETRGRGHVYVDCIGISWSAVDAICIPFMTTGNKAGYWTEDEEVQVVWRLYKLLTHPNVKVRWHNGLFDAQIVHHNWHFIPRGGQDTMISQHSLFAALPKALYFVASMYADHYIYWKDEGKIASDAPEEQRWKYNLQDCVYTREVGEVLKKSAAAMGLAQVDEWQQQLFYPVLNAMLRGVRVRPEVIRDMAMDVQEELSHREAFLYNVIGHSINPASPKQMQALFYDDLKQPLIYKRTVFGGKTKMAPTCDDEALTKIAAREPLLKPLCNAIADIRTLNKFLNDFVLMPLDTDGRMRCSFNIAGDAGGKSAPYSYRLSSGKNPFGSGGNLQTIPSEKSKSAGKAAARGSMDFVLPNIRRMYGPDAGFTFFDMDLDRADLQVVVRESGEKEWIAAMDLGVDMHLLNVFVLDKMEPPPYEELVETHPKYAEHRAPRKHKREFAKVFCHATNYVGGAKTVAAHTGRSVHEIDVAQKYWFSAHPGVLRWHQRVLDHITKRRFVENAFGYRWYIFDRLEGLLPEAVAWIPQSTVGIVINKIWARFYNEIPEVQVLLQVHDSLAGQFATHRKATLIPLMLEKSKVVIPYESPLVIPTGVKISDVSWGDCA